MSHLFTSSKRTCHTIPSIYYQNCEALCGERRRRRNKKWRQHLNYCGSAERRNKKKRKDFWNSLNSEMFELKGTSVIQSNWFLLFVHPSTALLLLPSTDEPQFNRVHIWNRHVRVSWPFAPLSIEFSINIYCNQWQCYTLVIKHKFRNCMWGNVQLCH